MNKQIWGGIIIWGIFVTCFGLGALNPASVSANSFTFPAADQELIFLLTGGVVTCLIGFIGLIGFMGWIPGFNQRSGAVVHCFRA